MSTSENGKKEEYLNGDSVKSMNDIKKAEEI